jgi:hypothetical protein
MNIANRVPLLIVRFSMNFHTKSVDGFPQYTSLCEKYSPGIIQISLKKISFRVLSRFCANPLCGMIIYTMVRK